MPDTHPYDEWADIYDRVYAYLDHDVAFYLQQAKAANGPVVELGCGTGRITLAIAAAGVQVTGVDISPQMIERAWLNTHGTSLGNHPHFVVGDMANVDVGRDFALACMPFRSFQSLIAVEDQRAALENAAAHLRPGGLLALDVFLPEIHQLGNPQDAAVPFHVRDVPQPDGTRLVIWGQNQFDPVTQVNSTRLIIEDVDTDGVVTQRLYRDFELRYTFRYELEHLLELTGFTPLAVSGDFEGGPVTDTTEDLVIVARKASP